jgi:hypothetical protein
MTAHAMEEMAEDDLDIIDVEGRANRFAQRVRQAIKKFGIKTSGM